MKSSNLAWRMEPPDLPVEPPAQDQLDQEQPLNLETRAHVRPRPSFERRTIEIRDAGFAPFRVR